MRYNTGNPVGPDGSSSPFDLHDNAGNIDILANDRAKLTSPDRLGEERKTWHGMEQEFDIAQAEREAEFIQTQEEKEERFQQFLLTSGYQDVGLYSPGINIIARNQIFLKDGEYYRAAASTDLPYTTTGVWADEASKFVSVGDAVLRQQLSAESGSAIGASYIGGGVQSVGTVAALRALSRFSPSKYAKVCGLIAKGDGWDGLYYLDPSDTATPENKAGTVIVAIDGGRWKSVDKSPKIPTVGQALMISGTGYSLRYPTDNVLKNSTFYIWHDSGPAGLPGNVPENANRMVCAQWRMETAGVGTTASSIHKITSPVGGLQFTASFGPSVGFVYVRQNVFGVQSFSGKMLTATVDIEVDVPCQLDFYARMRINALNDEANRPLIVDTDNINLSAGRQTVAVVMQCPNIQSYLGLEGSQQSLEYAFRVVGVGNTVVVKVYGASVTPGNVARAAGNQDPLRDMNEADNQYEIGNATVVGLVSSLGQKRISVGFKATKYRTPMITLADRLGSVGCISTYDAAGTRTDGVTGYSLEVTTTDFQLILPSSTAAGVYLTYAANSYF